MVVVESECFWNFSCLGLGVVAVLNSFRYIMIITHHIVHCKYSKYSGSYISQYIVLCAVYVNGSQIACGREEVSDLCRELSLL